MLTKKLSQSATSNKGLRRNLPKTNIVITKISGAAQPLEIMQALELERIMNHTWHIAPSDALHNEGVETGIKWLVDTVVRLRKENEMAKKMKN